MKVLGFVLSSMAALGTVSGFTIPRLEAMSRQPSEQQSSSTQRPGAYSKTSPVLKAAVGLLSGGLNNLARQEGSLASSAKVVPRLSPQALKKKIEEDYSNAYFLTGAITRDAYDENCVFTGVGTWSRNIANLKIFFRDPRLDLKGIRLDTTKQIIETQWRLTCELALPWRPFIDVEGGTVHRYDPSKGGRVVEHVESWAVSGLEAVLQLFRPGKGRPIEAQQGPSAATKVKSGFRLLANTVLPMSLSLLSSNAFTNGGGSLGNSPFVAAAHADDKRQVADIPASGLIFKDSINVEAFPDPKVQGVTIYISDFRRPLAERITKDFFSDPSQASVACVGSGNIKMNNIDMSKQGEEVFSEARSLLFKTIRVRRVYDKEANALIYVSYSTRFSKTDDDNKSRFKSSLCAIPLDQDQSTAGK